MQFQKKQKKQLDKQQKGTKQKPHTYKKWPDKTLQIYNLLTKKVHELPKAPPPLAPTISWEPLNPQLNHPQSPTRVPRSNAVMMKGISIRNRGCLYHLLEASHGGRGDSQGTAHPSPPRENPPKTTGENPGKTHQKHGKTMGKPPPKDLVTVSYLSEVFGSPKHHNDLQDV